MTHLFYRNASEKDLPKIVEIYNSIIANRMVTADTEPINVIDRINWFLEHSESKRPLWMVENTENEVIGWVSFQSFYGRKAYDGTVEISIYLDENFRGAGFGRQILQYCIDQSPKFGITTLLGYIFAHNLPSIQLFESFGFETWGFFPKIANLDGVERDLKILGYRINNTKFEN